MIENNKQKPTWAANKERLREIIKVCVTKEEKEQLKKEKERQGFDSLSAYMKHLALRDNEMEEKVNVIFRRITRLG